MGNHSGAVEVSVSGCGAESLGDWRPTLEDNVVVSRNETENVPVHGTEGMQGEER